jgi:hypothetical protein
LKGNLGPTEAAFDRISISGKAFLPWDQRVIVIIASPSKMASGGIGVLRVFEFRAIALVSYMCVRAVKNFVLNIWEHFGRKLY